MSFSLDQKYNLVYGFGPFSDYTDNLPRLLFPGKIVMSAVFALRDCSKYRNYPYRSEKKLNISEMVNSYWVKKNPKDESKSGQWDDISI